MQIDNLSWFPGHMTKTKRMISAEIKNMDAVCEIVDARIPMSSRNPDVDELTAGKPRLIVSTVPTRPTRPRPAAGPSISAPRAAPCWRPTPKTA